MHVRSGHDCKRWYLRPRSITLSTKPKSLAVSAVIKKIALQRLFDLLQRLASMLHVDLVEPLLEISESPGRAA